jgi:hypothetical protein
VPDTGYRWKQLNKLNHWTHVFPPVTFFGIVSAIEGKIFKMLGIVNLAAQQKTRILIWVCVVFLVAVLENVRVCVKLVT